MVDISDIGEIDGRILNGDPVTDALLDLHVGQLPILDPSVEFLQRRCAAVYRDDPPGVFPLLSHGKGIETDPTPDIGADPPSQAAYQIKKIVCVLEGLTFGGFKSGDFTSTDSQIQTSNGMYDESIEPAGEYYQDIYHNKIEKYEPKFETCQPLSEAW